MLRSSSLPGLLLALSLSPLCFATGITSVVYTNTSPADLATNAVSYQEEFRSTGSVGGVTNTTNTSSVSAQLQWFGAYRASGNRFANSIMIYPSFTLAFTVADPNNIGYTLSLDTLMRGYLSALYTSGPANNIDFDVRVAGADFSVWVDSGSGEAFDSALSSFTGTSQLVDANETTTSRNVLASSSTSGSLGSFTGTRNFLIRLSQSPSPVGTVVIQNDIQGEGSLRFGLNPTVPTFSTGVTPGPDGEAGSNHGLFVTATARFNQDIPSGEIPEPSTFGLLLPALLLLPVLRKR